ncbi:MAG TPA: 16S rRNA (cytidine(1402)-2'-O)-methyltransferase [Candidatus Paceibacterota bacterium]|nr:16S rRNA (cytidine(1402)-2'-O)-methyltransferase [Candidatus Paceibacterota bacterium]HMP19269.1 16S rRNA (cytidine(1402)-2'-O)-methyltransferase [Candidatus Paceibacterota bacterium]HMP85558.1 16S rRNA (cytidine(1402)-2'-O)-methyltransferase [Candidatus Paceibacterota bacterium]
MLYIVATPIGNLEDITLRALRILGEVDFVLAEDTRNTKKLLNYYKIQTPTISFHEYSDENKYQKIFEMLDSGKKLALVTDAGTPAISDPGGKLVLKIRDYLKKQIAEKKESEKYFLQNFKIESVPGPSSLTTAISIAGLPTTKFYFAGFAPHKKGRQTFFSEISQKFDNENIKDEEKTAFIFFESPHRILKSLELLNRFCPDKKVFLIKEISKIFEEVMIGKPQELLGLFNQNQAKLRGEFVVIVL